MLPKEWLTAYFSERTKLPENFERANFFESKMIDSLGVLELIEAIESKYKITFESSHFQDRRFPTISGLSEIIDEIKSRQHG
jgi:acyl carrier protein